MGNPTALMLGDFKNFTDENVKQVKKYIKEIGQVCIQITSPNNNSKIFKERKTNIKNKLNESGISYKAKYIIIEVPNITTQIKI